MLKLLFFLSYDNISLNIFVFQLKLYNQKVIIATLVNLGNMPNFATHSFWQRVLSQFISYPFSLSSLLISPFYPSSFQPSLFISHESVENNMSIHSGLRISYESCLRGCLITT